MSVRNADTNAMLHGGAWPVIKAVGDVEFTIGTEAANVILVTIQLKDTDGNNADGYYDILVSVHDAVGGALCSDTPFSATPFTTGVLLAEITTDKAAWARTNASGQAVLSITDAGTDTFYISASCGTVQRWSAAVNFAA